MYRDRVSVGSGVYARKWNFYGRDNGAETVSLKFNRLFAETRRSYTQPRYFGHFASQELIIVWLEVRVLPAPPRSPSSPM
jgi:hypothetical protein